MQTQQTSLSMPYRAGQRLNIVPPPPAGDGSERLVEIFPELHKLAQRQLTRVALSHKRRIVFVNLSDIVTVVAQGNYVLLQRESGSYCLRGPISAMAEKLEPYGFVRIHRSVLVNKRWVEEIRPCLTGEYALRLKGQKEFTVTRTYKKNLKSLAEVWLSSHTFLEDAEAH